MAEKSAIYVKDEVSKLDNQFGVLWASGDAYQLSKQLFGQDCCIMPPNAPITYNQAGAHKCFGRLMTTSLYKGIKLMVAEVDVCDGGAIAIERGCYKFNGQDKQILETGKYITIWKRNLESGGLQIASFIWNLSG